MQANRALFPLSAAVLLAATVSAQSPVSDILTRTSSR